MNDSSLVRKWAVLLVMALTICLLLLSGGTKQAGQTDLNMRLPSQPRYVTTLDRPRPEIRIERLLNLEDPNDFDPDLTSLLKRKRQAQRGKANSSALSYQLVASVSHDQKGVQNQ
jgi:hypothetical protein